MSKMDNLRAMREARYEESQARGRANATATTGKPSVAAQPKPATQPERTPTLAVVPDPPESASETEQETAPEEALCGHRNMGGRTCTREAGHSAKSHRYS